MITAIRDIRVKNDIKPKEKIKLHIGSMNTAQYEAIRNLLVKQVQAEEICFVQEPPANAITVVIGKDRFYILSEKEVDTVAQKEKLLKDLHYFKDFLVSVEKKLSNERFVAHAKPEVVENERRKKQDAEQKIKAIEESLKA